MRLRALIRHCTSHVPYYHQLFKDNKLDPTEIRTIKDLPKIPILTKEILRQTPLEQFLARNINPKDYVIRHTSGTSGIPLSIYKTRNEWLDDRVRVTLNQLLVGDRIYHKRVESTRWGLYLPRLLQKLRLFPTLYISPFEDPLHQLKKIQAFNPQTLLALPSWAVILAKEQRIQEIPGIDISFVFTVGELLDREARAIIQETFHAEVFDAYGSAEMQAVYLECKEHSYHIQSDINIVEAVKRHEPLSIQEEGDIVVTNLLKYAMPILRYNSEDCGYRLDEPCSCDCAFPLMMLTSGRTQDVIVFPDGHMISAHEATIILRTHMYRLKQFQIIQENQNLLRIQLVKGEGFHDSIVTEIQRDIAQKLESKMEIQVDVVDSIPREKSGKFKSFKTNLKPQLT
jgi:phenylacetate-CoA ligase